MSIQVTGKNMETGDSFQTYVTDKARAVLDKYIGPEISGHIRIEKIRGQFHTHCSMRLRTGLMLESNGNAGDPFASADVALERLEKRVRRYKGASRTITTAMAKWRKSSPKQWIPSSRLTSKKMKIRMQMHRIR